MPSSTLARTACAAALALGLALGGCRSADPTVFIPAGGTTTIAKVEALAEQTDLSAVASVEVQQAPDARLGVLVWLRGRGADGERAATLLTIGFPERTAAVPVRIEVANVDGVRSLIAVEAYGDASGPLVHRRLWVFDLATGKLTRSASYR